MKKEKTRREEGRKERKEGRRRKRKASMKGRYLYLVW